MFKKIVALFNNSTLCVALSVTLVTFSGCSELKVASSHSVATSTPEPRSRWDRIAFAEIGMRLDDTGERQLRDSKVRDGDVEIRIWSGFDTLPLRGLILRQKGGDWSALYLRGLPKEDGAAWEPTNLPPPSGGWDNLWSRLHELDLLRLPDAADLRLSRGGFESTHVVVELLDREGYHTYSLFGFDEFEDPAVKSLKEACELLSKEFDIYILESEFAR